MERRRRTAHRTRTRMRHSLALEALLVCALPTARVPLLSRVALIPTVLQVFSCVSPTPLQAASKNTLCQLDADCDVLG